MKVETAVMRPQMRPSAAVVVTPSQDLTVSRWVRSPAAMGGSLIAAWPSLPLGGKDRAAVGVGESEAGRRTRGLALPRPTPPPCRCCASAVPPHEGGTLA